MKSTLVPTLLIASLLTHFIAAGPAKPEEYHYHHGRPYPPSYHSNSVSSSTNMNQDNYMQNNNNVNVNSVPAPVVHEQQPSFVSKNIALNNDQGANTINATPEIRKAIPVYEPIKASYVARPSPNDQIKANPAPPVIAQPQNNMQQAIITNPLPVVSQIGTAVEEVNCDDH
jgi:hypothetical protein